MKIKILFTGGGTGGHLFPILAIARELRIFAGSGAIELHYIGPSDKAGQVLLSQESFKIHSILSGKIRRYFSFENVTDILFKMPLGFAQSFFILLFSRPKLVFSKGGSGSAVVILAAKILGIPIFIHESDSAPGQSNRFAAPFAKKIFTAFEKTSYFDLSKTIWVGNPILTDLLEGNNESAKEIFGLTFEKPVLMVWGGSQGAEAINDFVLAMLNDLLKSYEIIHVCGKKNHAEVFSQSEVILDGDAKKYYHLWEFLDEVPLKHALKAANLIISRAGSGSIFEMAACGKPSILIPLPSSANNHQSKNAYAYAQNGAAIVIEQDNLKPNFFLEKISFLFTNPEELEAMKTAALQFSKPLAAKAIAREILEYLNIQ